MKILIPAFEPTDKIIKLIDEIQSSINYQIIIVNDGSGEEYTYIFNKLKNMGCIVLNHSKNLGKGEALKTGFRYIIYQNEKENVVCADCDGQHTVRDIIRVAESISEDNQMVLGVRNFKENDIPFKSKFGNKISSLTFVLSTGKWVKDTQTGLRGYPYCMLSTLCLIEGSRYEYEFNMLLDLKKYGITIKEIPISTIYENNNKGTHFRPIMDSIRIYYPILKFSSSSLISGILDFILLFTFKYLTNSLFLGVAIARIISSIFNYSVNKILVFKANETKPVLKYFGLVIVIMLLNYYILSLLIYNIHITPVLAKIFTEAILFVLSYIVQKKFVFKLNI